MFTKEFILPSVEKLCSELPLTSQEKTYKQANDKKIKDILDGVDNRKVLIVGPCSADSEAALLKYLEKIVKIADNFSDRFYIIPRIYTSKSRSLCYNYAGMISTSSVNGKIDFVSGIFNARKLHLKALREFGLSGADEIVYPDLVFYLKDLVSYFVIGARNSTSTLHRQVASGLDTAVGLKNDLSGNFRILSEGIQGIKSSNTFALCGIQYATTGNKYVHGVLRGVNTEENYRANITEDLLFDYFDKMDQRNMSSLILDLSHGNSGKNAMGQFRSLELIGSAIKDKRIKGFMIESYLYDGVGLEEGFSKTDPCLGVENTLRLIEKISEKL